MKNLSQQEMITLGGGCFWCLEAVYINVEGVLQVESGYSGGSVPNPSYELVCSGTSGHAEVVRVTFNPNVISVKEILEIFFSIHDPTTLNRQGADVGTQYRSAIFFHTPEQETIARQVITELQQKKIWKDPIVTELAAMQEFYKAEDYHQDYFKRNPNQMYCRVVIEPKLSKFRKQYQHKLILNN